MSLLERLKKNPVILTNKKQRREVEKLRTQGYKIPMGITSSGIRYFWMPDFYTKEQMEERLWLQNAN